MLNPSPMEQVKFCKNIRITGTGAITANIFQLTKSVRVVEQVAEIVSVTTLTNATNIYSDLYDGTNTVNLTADGIALSGAPVGTVFTKDKVATETYSLMLADECRMNEVLSDRRSGSPFTIVQKNGADTFIRLHLTTTDAPVDFTIHLRFIYEPVDGGRLDILV